VLASQILHAHPIIGLPQEPDDLLFRKSLLHVQPRGRGQTLNSSATQRRGDLARALMANWETSCRIGRSFTRLERLRSSSSSDDGITTESDRIAHWAIDHRHLRRRWCV
jgi:hypothetical protein